MVGGVIYFCRTQQRLAPSTERSAHYIEQRTYRMHYRTQSKKHTAQNRAGAHNITQHIEHRT